MGLISRVSSRTYRRKNFLKTNMKTVNAVFDVDLAEFGEDVKLVVKGQKITVTGPRGTLSRDFSHLKVEVKKTGKQACKFTKWWSTKREIAALRTAASHVKNMATGVTSGFRYKIRNFLGEKINREVAMLDGVTIKSSPKQKDEFWFEGNDIENVSRSCALVHQKAFVRNKDIRKFLDGIYVSQKT